MRMLHAAVVISLLLCACQKQDNAQPTPGTEGQKQAAPAVKDGEKPAPATAEGQREGWIPEKGGEAKVVEGMDKAAAVDKTAEGVDKAAAVDKTAEGREKAEGGAEGKPAEGTPATEGEKAGSEPTAEKPAGENPPEEGDVEKSGGKSGEKKYEKKGELPEVIFETTKGTIRVELYPDKTPITVKNFLQYAEDGFYVGTVFHRVVAGFVIQGGGYSSDLAEQPTRAPIENEAAKGISNARGTLSMARTNQRNSATSQFYVNLRNNTMLDYRGENPQGWGYCAFGKVTEGMEVVDAIAAVRTGAAGMFPAEVPQEPIIINKVTVLK